MPFGTFLNNFPTPLFVGAHIVMLAIGLWAIMRLRATRPEISGLLWLYVISQPVCLAYFAKIITIRTAVLTEQTLIVAMVIWLALGATGRSATTSR